MAAAAPADDALDKAARAAGVILSRPGEDAPPVSRQTKEALVAALGPARKVERRPHATAFVPPLVDEERILGLSLQLYQLRSQRNLGIGDLGDLIALIPTLADAGVDFVGLNPLHALFTADPERASPFAPSDRRFLNPFIIAADRVAGYAPRFLDGLYVPDAKDLVQYGKVGPLKLTVLSRTYEAWIRGGASASDQADYEAFVRDRGKALDDFALFEALSHHMVETGHGAGTKTWPSGIATRDAQDVEAYAKRLAGSQRFHRWLQFIAHQQVVEVQQRAKEAGIRLGLYLDLAVGTARDGAAVWSDPALSMPQLRIGAPPDLFSNDGQDWDLAPLSPGQLVERDFAPYRAVLAAVMGPAGAMRIDHAMGLERIWLIPDGMTATEGAYVSMPGLTDEVVAASHRHRALAIGEDLGIVPPGFRERMTARRLFSMRIVMFERDGDELIAPKRYPMDALACLSTHDIAPLDAWWDGVDLDTRQSIGVLAAADAARERSDRETVKIALLEFVGLSPTLAHKPVTPKVRKGLHATLGRTACRLASVRLEDVVGAKRLVNVPGTDREHPNWRRTLPVTVDEIAGSERLREVLAAVRSART